MSSSRSIAGARQRRAGEAPPTSGRNNSTVTSQQFLAQQGQQQQQQYTNTSAKFQSLNSGSGSNFSNQQQPNMISASTSTNALKQGPIQIGNGPGQLSVSDAFALVTLRLGKMESLIKKWQEEGFPGETSTQPGIDTSIIQAIVSRIEKVELSTNTLIANKITAQSIQQPSASPSLVHSPQQWKAMEEKIIVEVENKLGNIVKDILELKDTLIKVQSFTMETNQKLVNAIFQENENELMMMQMMRDLGTNEDEEENEDQDQDQDQDQDEDQDQNEDQDQDEENNDAVGLEEGDNNRHEIEGENITVNLKEIIKNELKLTEIS